MNTWCIGLLRSCALYYSSCLFSIPRIVTHCITAAVYHLSYIRFIGAVVSLYHFFRLFLYLYCALNLLLLQSLSITVPCIHCITAAVYRYYFIVLSFYLSSSLSLSLYRALYRSNTAVSLDHSIVYSMYCTSSLSPIPHLSRNKRSSLALSRDGHHLTLPRDMLYGCSSLPLSLNRTLSLIVPAI